MERKYWDKKDKATIQKFFSTKFHSLAELVSYVDSELKPRHVLLNQLASYFQLAILNNPHWLAKPQDFDLLLQNEYFWVQYRNKDHINTRSLEGMILETFKKMVKEYPTIWKYEPGSSEELHKIYIQRLKDLDLFPQDLKGKFKLWKKLVLRGVTSITDALFSEIYSEALSLSEQELSSLGGLVNIEALALDGRVWEPKIKALILENTIKQSSVYETLKETSDKDMRLNSLKLLMGSTHHSFPEQGATYIDFLERLSNEIRSTPEESSLIHKAKYPDGGERQEDFGLRFFSQLIAKITSWRLKHQWHFILFLRGEVPAGPKIKKLFKTIGTERIKRIFSLFPQVVKTSLLDTLLDAPHGLTPTVHLNKGYTNIIVDYLLKHLSPENQVVTRQILEAFLYSLEKTGNTGLKSYVLAYLLAMPSSEIQSSGQVLKNILEVFGTTGIKIGQFILAAHLLPESETKHLRALQDKALIPERQSIYNDLRQINHNQNLPVEVQDLLGAASLKYAVSAKQNHLQHVDKKIVLKVLRLEAIANTPMQFRQLDAMADYLTQKFGSRYGIFRSIVYAAQHAVKRELSLKNEATKSKMAQQNIYQGYSHPSTTITVPKSFFLNDRLIAEEFVEGVSIFDIEKAEHRSFIAQRLLEVEGYNLFQEINDPKAVIVFDPDRHPGNYRIRIEDHHVYIHPIDWGQMVSITVQQRDQIFTLFALAQIMKMTGPVNWIVNKIIDEMHLSVNVKSLTSALKRYFPSKEIAEVTAYYSILAALSDLKMHPDIVYFDFVKGIIQLNQYEAFLLQPTKTPVARLKEAVSLKVKKLLPEMTLSLKEKVQIGVPRKISEWFKDSCATSLIF